MEEQFDKIWNRLGHNYDGGVPPETVREVLKSLFSMGWYAGREYGYEEALIDEQTKDVPYGRIP